MSPCLKRKRRKEEGEEEKEEEENCFSLKYKFLDYAKTSEQYNEWLFFSTS